MSHRNRLILTVLIAVTIAEALSLVGRGSEMRSDIGVFFRECDLLARGSSGDFYGQRDPFTDWPMSLSPAGLAMLQPLVGLGPLGASLGWAAVNLALVGASLIALRRFLRHAVPDLFDRVFPAAAMLFVVLSWGSIQVGQFSLLFATCWILFLAAFIEGRYIAAAFLLAIPGAIKVYPLLLLSIPVSLAMTTRAAGRHVLLALLAMIVLCIGVPAAMYGTRVWALNLSFWNNIILSGAQVDFMQTLHTGANQSLDTVLLRYLTYEPEFHGLHPSLPHLQLGREAVLQYANLVRVLVFLVSCAIAWRWRRRHATRSAHDVMMIAALWTSAMYLMLPETKARYAIYTFIAFLPWLEAAMTERASSPGEPSIARFAIAACAILVVVFVPNVIEAYGVGVIGSVVLWLGNVHLLARAGSPAAVPEPRPVWSETRATISRINAG